MKKPNIILIFAGTILLLHSCVTKYEPDIPLADKRQLVVEGLITDEVGPFRVRLTNTFDINKNKTFGDPVTTAQVQIFDDRGNLYPLYYTTNGWYQTTDTLLRGIPGTTYDLNITTEDGTQYESSPVLMQDVPNIDSVYFKEVSKIRFENDGTAINENWLNIMLDSHDPTGQTKYWKWNYVETWEVKIPTDSVIYEYSTMPVLTTLVNMKASDHVKTTCWVIHPSQTILVSSTKDKSEDKISQFPLISIPPDNDRLHIEYSILVKQTALSPEMYQFWKKLKDSNEETGGIYEKPPQQVYANISCCDGKSKVVGYFWASAVRTKRIFISKYDQPIRTKSAYAGCIYYGPKSSFIITACAEFPEFVGSPIGALTDYCNDCRAYGTFKNGYGSDKKPDFWK